MDTITRSRALRLSLVLCTLAMCLFAFAAQASAQQLIAWPIGGGPFSHLLPGMPVRPLPPGGVIRPPVVRPPVVRPVPTPQTPGDRVENGASPVTLAGYQVNATVRDEAAELAFDIVFHNPTQQRLEGVLLVPIPANAVLSNFTMTVGGKEMKGEVLESGQAATIYENIVRQMRDPGLLELVGERLFRARVFPIEPGTDIAVKLTMTQVLPKSGGLTTLTIPVRSAQMLQGRRGDTAVNVKLATTRPIRTLYSPDSRLSISRQGERAATASFRAGAGREEGDVSLFFSTQDDPLAASVLAFRETGEDGYFMVSLSPRPQATAQAVPKDVVFIVDRSGSMEEGGKMDQARKALAYCIKRLNPGDRFGIVDFATDWSSLDSKLLQATSDNKERGVRYIERLDAAGGTNIEAGLTEGLKLLTPAPGRMPLVFFMTDGLPTVGQSDAAQLLRQAQASNSALKARLFSFGVGSDVNTLFLDKLAQGNRGTGDYVQPGENIEAKVSTLYQKVARPAMTDVRLDWQGVDAVAVYPKPVPDLFYGSELVVLGRYKAGAKGRLVVTGRAANQDQRFEFPVDLPARSSELSFLPRLWANARVSAELDGIRLSGRADPEVVNDIVRLAKRYGIVTPYTSYLITEEGRDEGRARNLAVSAVRGMAQDAALSGGGGASGAAVSFRAQRASRLMSSMAKMAAPSSMIMGAAQAPTAAAEMDDAREEAKKEAVSRGLAVVATRTVGDKTFYKRGDVWTDGDAEAEGFSPRKTVSVGYLSDEYFELLRAKPELGRYLAVGAPLKLVRDGVLYEVSR
jgi:Ca-activated chloride channel family protein